MEATIHTKPELSPITSPTGQLIEVYKAIAVHEGKPTLVATAKIYSTRASSTCMLRIVPDYRYVSAKSTGYGYHRVSDAFSKACDKAGITFNEEIAGRGGSAIERALEAIAVGLGFENTLITYVGA